MSTTNLCYHQGTRYPSFLGDVPVIHPLQKEDIKSIPDSDTFYLFDTGNLMMSDGFTYLMKLCFRPNDTKVLKKYLAKHPEEVHKTLPINGITPLMIAVLNCRTESCGQPTPKWSSEKIVRILLDAKSNINAQNNSTGFTVLMEAIRHDDSNLVKMLLNYNANVNMKSNSHFTPLMLACSYKYKTDIIKMLVEAKADVNVGNHYNNYDGLTPLMRIAHYYNPKEEEAIRILINAKADPIIRDKRNRTAYDMLDKKKDISIETLLMLCPEGELYKHFNDTQKKIVKYLIKRSEEQLLKNVTALQCMHKDIPPELMHNIIKE